MTDGGVTIGRVSVRVMPDTSKFRRDLKNDLERIEKGLKVEVDALLNSKMLARHADAVVQRMNSKAERSKRQIIFDADLDTNNIERRAREVSAEVDRSLHDAVLDLTARLDEETLRHVRRELNDVIDDYDGKEIDLQAAVDSVIARAELARVSRDRFVTLHVRVSETSLAKAEATLAALSGLRMLSSTLDNLWNLFKNLDKNIPLIGSVAEAVMGLSAWLLAAASNTFALAKSLAQIGGLALLLPGILGGFAFGLGATFAVLKDFNDVLPEVGRELSRIQDVMSVAFWSQAETPIRNLTNTLLPQLESGLHQTSVALGGFFGSLADELRGSLDGELDGMFANLAASIDIAASSNGAFANSIAILGRKGSQYLPRLAAWYSDITTRFSEWLTKADQTGRLNEIIETAITNAKDLGTVLFEAGGILAGIARAAERAGGSSLAMLADTLERIHETVDSPAFQDGLVEVLEAAHDAMSRIANDSGPAVKSFFSDFSTTLADGFRSAGDAIGSLLDGIFRGLNTDGFATGFLDFLNGIRDGIRALAPMWEPLGEAIGAIGTLAGELARNFGPLLTQVLTSLSRMVVDLMPQILPVVDALTSTLSGALSIVIPVVEALVTVFGNLVGPLLSSEAGVIAVTTALVGFRIAVASRSMEAGLAALLSFFGAEGKARGMASAITTLGTKLGLIGTAVAAVVGVVTWASQLGVQAAEVDDFSIALERLGNQGTVQNIAKLEGLFQGGDSWLQESGESAADVQSLADAIGYLEGWNSSGWWEKFLGGGKSGDGLWMHSAAMNQSEESVKNLDSALAKIASSGNADALAAAQDWLSDSAAKSGMSVDELAKTYLPEYSRALESNAVAQQYAAQQAQQAAFLQESALLQYEDAIKRVNGVSPLLLDSINETSKSFIDFGAAMQGEALPSVEEFLTALERQVEAQRNWADNMAALAKRGVSEGVLAEFDKLGAEGAPMVEQFVTASDSELARLEEAFLAKSEGAVSNATGEFAKLDEKVRTELSKLSPTAQAALSELGIEMNTGGAEAGQNLADGLASQAAQVYSATGGLGRTAVDGANTAKPGMGTSGQGAGSAFVGGVGSRNGDARTAGSGLASAADGGARGVSLYSAGQWVAQGFANGISSMVSSVVSAASSMASQAAAAATKFLNIGSPSRLFHQYGAWVTEGFANGITSKAKLAVAAMKDVADAVSKVDMDHPLASRGTLRVRTGAASASAALADGGTPTEGVSVPVYFNAPVGGDPYEIAAGVQQKVLDGLAAEGLA